MDTYAEMVFPNLQDMVNTADKLGAAQDAGDIEQVRQLGTQYLLYYNALKLAPTSWCTQQMHQEFLLYSEAFLNSVELWVDGDLEAAASLLQKANQHWNEAWEIYDRHAER